MNYDFLASLPWRLGSFAGLVVGIIALLCGVIDYTVILMRMGIGFIAFYVIGVAASMVLRSVAGVYSIRRPNKKPNVKPVEAESNPAPPENSESGALSA